MTMGMRRTARCVTCGEELVGEYCHACGEKRRDERDLTLRSFAHYAVEAVTNADAKVWATLRTLVARPGRLTREFEVGRRRPYLGPLQLFLVVNLVYFVLLQAGWGTDALTTDLLFHPSQPVYGAYAAARMESRIGSLPERDEAESVFAWHARWNEEQQEVRIRFNEASPRYANSLVILLVPLFATGLRLLRLRGPFVRDLVFSLHFLALLMLLMIVLPLPFILLLLLVPALLPYLAGEAVFGVALAAVVVLYLAVAFRRAYGDGWLAAGARAGASLALLFVVVTIYRFVLFLVVFRTV